MQQLRGIIRHQIAHDRTLTEPHKKNLVSARPVLPDDLTGEFDQQFKGFFGRTVIDGDAAMGKVNGKPAIHAKVHCLWRSCTDIAEFRAQCRCYLNQIFFVTAISVKHDHKRGIFRFCRCKVQISE